MEVWGGNHAVDQGVAMPGLDLWVHSAPHEGMEQGGDVHYVSSCGTGRISRLVVADVSGHGASVAEFARGLRTLMRRFVNYLDQTRFVEALNQGFVAGDSGRFATSVAMTYFAPTRRLDLVNAGHPRPLLRRAADRSWTVLEAPRTDGGRSRGAPSSAEEVLNLPLGVLEPTRYDQFGLTLAPDDLVLVYTDAVVESRSPEGTMLGEQGLLEMVRRLDTTRPEAFIPALLAALERYRGGVPADDDETLLLLRHNGTSSRAPIHQRLWASVKFLGLLLRSLIPLGSRPPIPWPEMNKANILGPFSRKAEGSWGRGGD